MRFALFKEVPERQRRKKRKLNSGAAVRKGSEGSDNEGDEDESDEEQEPAPTERMTTPTTAISAPAAQLPQDPIWGDDSQDVSMIVDAAAAGGATPGLNLHAGGQTPVSANAPSTYRPSQP
jgi:DNA replication licensing factor MCM3